MALVLTILFVVIPITELVVVIEVAKVIGGPATLLALILFCAAGAWVVKNEGLAALRRVQAAMREGRVPTDEMTDGGLVVLAGIMMLLPGFVTSFLGLLLLIPAVRRGVRAASAGFITARVAKRFPTVGDRVRADRPRADRPRNERPRADRSGTDRPRADGGPTGPRPYRRPDEPWPNSSDGAPWRTRVRPPDARSDDVIDVDGEEIDFPFGTDGELPPTGSR